ncbi:MAG: hypothetical protein K2N34_07470 [Lachnospiraceae bacterium]|nr:hypothetical protein [Lachnospiraceae bacterium]
MLQSKFEKQELQNKSVEELRKICKAHGISYYEHSKRLNKGAMISKLLTDVLEDVSDIKDKDDNDCCSRNTCFPMACVKGEDEQVEESVKTKEQIAIEEAERLENKKKYVEQAKVGTIVALKLSSGKVISASITKKSTKGRKFMVETKYGMEYKISFDDVLWVRTNNKRWPKGIYQLFKQNIKVEVPEDGEEIC